MLDPTTSLMPIHNAGTKPHGEHVEVSSFNERLAWLRRAHATLLERPNKSVYSGGVVDRFANPVVTAAHTPLEWRYDLDERTNPHLMERLAINAAFNAGAIEDRGRVLLCVRVEGADRKSFFAMAESRSGIDGFHFWELPVSLPDTDPAETNVYDMRLVRHEDGWVYGTFCSERHDELEPADLSAAVSQCGIVRTTDFVRWERLPALRTASRQQRNVVLHPEFVNGQYAFYTRPLTAFAATGAGDGIHWGTCDDITNPVLDEEQIWDSRRYHTIDEGKNGLGPAPIKTEDGWLHLAHGVRTTAAGLRYVLYVLLASLDDPSRVIKKPAGYFLAPEGEERVGDVSNVLFSNGWVARQSGEVLVYYASSDTRMHVARTSVERLLDYVHNTPEDALRSADCVQQRIDLIQRNRELRRS
jgi:4-O-beta-D-mannosyl-D-glucose phosphorylase